jgi:hypothetical protein
MAHLPTGADSMGIHLIALWATRCLVHSGRTVAVTIGSGLKYQHRAGQKAADMLTVVQKQLSA